MSDNDAKLPSPVERFLRDFREILAIQQSLGRTPTRIKVVVWNDQGGRTTVDETLGDANE